MASFGCDCRFWGILITSTFGYCMIKILGYWFKPRRCPKIWKNIFASQLKGKPVSRVLAMHLHGDHTGNAGWICRESESELWMTRSDFCMCKVMAADGPNDVGDGAIKSYRSAGFDESRLLL